MSDAVTRYIQRAIELAENSKDELTEVELREIAAELGLSDADLARVEDEIKAHVERGNGFARHEMWDDAVRELEAANALGPARLKILEHLAAAYESRHEHTQFPPDKQRAEELARACLQLDPDHRASFELLARLAGEQTPRAQHAAQPVAPAPKAGLAAVLTLMALVAAAATGGATYLLVATETSPTSDPRPALAPEIVDPPVVEQETGDRNLEVEYIEDDDARGMTFETRRAVLSVYTDSAFLNFWGTIQPNGDRSFDEVKLRLELLDDTGAVVATDTFAAHQSYQPALHPGDLGAFAHLMRAKRNARSARVSVAFADARDGAAPVPPGEVLEVDWQARKPDGIEVEIRERSHSFNPAPFMKSGYMKASLEVENKGRRPIRSLRIVITMYDAKGKKIGTEDGLVTFSSAPQIRTGEVRLKSVIEDVPLSYDHYSVAITQIE